MTDPRLISIIIGVIVASFAIWQRTRIFALTCTGVFFVSHFLFVLLGALLVPWLIEGYLPASYNYMNLGMLDDGKVCMTILIITIGLGLVFLGNTFQDLLLWRTRSHPEGMPKRPRSIKALDSKDTASTRRLKALFIVSAGLTFCLMLYDWDAIWGGVKHSLFSLDVESFYQARAEVGSTGRLFFVLIFNVLPFLSITAWMYYVQRRGLNNKLWAIFMIVSSSVFLLLTFQKRPLLLYLICLFAANNISKIWADKRDERKLSTFSGSHRLILKSSWKSMVFPLIFVFLVACYFFYISTNIRSFWEIAIAIIDRIVGRLALMPFYYVSYFPDIDPYYGLNNVGLYTSLLGIEHYPDTIRAVDYFSFVQGEGSGAIGTLIDFYGAFGWAGLIVCCFCLGILLHKLDKWLSSLRPNILNRSLYLFMLVFAYYLSQASIFRSLLSYGGLTFPLLWFLLKLNVSRGPGGMKIKLVV